MTAFREEIAREVRRQMMDPEFDARRSKNGGRVFWVRQATSANFGDFVKQHPAYDDGIAAVHETMSSAAAAVVADRGDEIRVGPGHTEEFEKAFCLSTAGVRWVGEGSGTKAPELTISGAIHGVAIEAAGVEFDNFRFASPPIDRALSMIRVKAAGCRVANIFGRGAAAGASREFVDCIRVIAGANDLTLENITLWGGSEGRGGPDSFLNFEGSISRFYASGFYAVGSVGIAGVRDAASVNIRDAYIEKMRVAVRGPSRPALTLDVDIDFNGIVRDSSFAGTVTTLANVAAFEDGWRLFDVKLLEETVSTAQGALIPAVDSD